MRFCVFTLSIPALGIFEITKQIQFGDFVTPWQGVVSKVFRQNVSNTKRVCSKSIFDKFIVNFWLHFAIVFLGEKHKSSKSASRGGPRGLLGPPGEQK